MSWGRAFSSFLAVLGRLIGKFTKRAPTLQHHFLPVRPARGDNTMYNVCSFLKSILFHFFLTKYAAKVICQIPMSRFLTSHIETSSAGHIFEDNINIHVNPPGSSGSLPEMKLDSRTPGSEAEPPRCENTKKKKKKSFFF